MIRIDVGPGELIDKITILQIKAEQIRDPGKLTNIRNELALLVTTRDQSLPASTELDRLSDALRSVNQELWQIEDAIRDCERASDFGAHFIELARSVYRRNDERAKLKRQINDLFGSAIIEEKSYAKY